MLSLIDELFVEMQNACGIPYRGAHVGSTQPLLKRLALCANKSGAKAPCGHANGYIIHSPPETQS
jgi:hypothetical protein